jgi:glutamyl endopeptidase
VSLEESPWGNPRCSGVVYGTSWIVTAGHCLLDNKGWHWPLWISRGRDGSSFPYGTCQSINYAFDTWTAGGSTGTDFAAIKMACGVPGTYGAGIEPLVAIPGSNFSFGGWATGYPACCDPMPPGSSIGQQWEAYGYIISNTATSWQYSATLDMTTGQSGGPATRLCGAWGWGECVVGINSRTQYRFWGSWNEAKRWVSADIASLAYWRDNL